MRRCSTRSDVLPRVARPHTEQQQADGCGYDADGAGADRTADTNGAIGAGRQMETRRGERLDTSSLGGGSVDGMRRRAIENAAAGIESPRLCNGKVSTATAYSHSTATVTGTASSSGKSSTVTNPAGGSRTSFSAGGLGAIDACSTSTGEAAVGELPDPLTVALSTVEASTGTLANVQTPKTRPLLLAYEVFTQSALFDI